MPRTARLTYLWPGLAELWTGGSWRALGAALVFAALLDGLLAATLIWQEVLSGPLLATGWLALAVSAVGAAVMSGRRTAAASAENQEPSLSDLFCAAQSEYLKGHWFESERLARRILERAESDVEARLLLATVLRRSGRVDEARSQLVRLQCTEGWERWKIEVAQEQEQLKEANREWPAQWEQDTTRAQNTPREQDTQREQNSPPSVETSLPAEAIAKAA